MSLSGSLGKKLPAQEQTGKRTFILYTSHAGLVIEKNRIMAALLLSVDRELGVHTHIFSTNETNEFPKDTAIRVFRDEPIEIDVLIAKSSLPRGNYLAFSCAGEDSAVHRIKIARSIVVSAYGEPFAKGEIVRLCYDFDKEQEINYSNSKIVGSPYESLSSVSSNGFHQGISAISKKSDHPNLIAAIRYYYKSIEEEDTLLKYFLVLLAIEALGLASNLAASIKKPYIKDFKTQHLAGEKMYTQRFKKYRDEFAHKANAKPLGPELERLLNIIFFDCLMYFATGESPKSALDALKYIKDEQ